MKPHLCCLNMANCEEAKGADIRFSALSQKNLTECMSCTAKQKLAPSTVKRIRASCWIQAWNQDASTTGRFHVQTLRTRWVRLSTENEVAMSSLTRLWIWMAVCAPDY
jgi:hypothetical protein